MKKTTRRSKNAEAIAEIAWESLRRNKDYIEFQKRGRNKMYKTGPAFNMLESTRRFGVQELIPPSINYGEKHTKACGIVAKGRTEWSYMFVNYTEPVTMTHPSNKKSFSSVKCIINLNFPRTVIEERFKKTLSSVYKDVDKYRSRFRLQMKGKQIDSKYYKTVFSVYDMANKIKATGKRVSWKTLHPDMSAKKAMDAYKKAKDLIESGVRRIT